MRLTRPNAYQASRSPWLAASFSQYTARFKRALPELVLDSSLFLSSSLCLFVLFSFSVLITSSVLASSLARRSPSASCAGTWPKSAAISRASMLCSCCQAAQ